MITLPDWALLPLELAVNGYLTLDEERRGQISDMDGRVIAIEFRGVATRIYFVVEGEHLRVRGAYATPADVTLRGGIFSLAHMGLKRSALFVGEVDIIGNTEVGQRFKALLDGVNIDWEEHLARLVGDVLAHHVGNSVRDVATWLRHAGDSVSCAAVDYAQEEIRCLPAPAEVRSYLDDVDELRAAVDRLNARVERITAAVEKFL